MGISFVLEVYVHTCLLPEERPQTQRTTSGDSRDRAGGRRFLSDPPRNARARSAHTTSSMRTCSFLSGTIYICT